MFFCALCGESLDLVEMLNMNLDEVDRDNVCGVCMEEEELISRYGFDGR